MAMNKRWDVNANNCEGSGVTELCDVVAASQGLGQIDVIEKKLACGCVLTPGDPEEVPPGHHDLTGDNATPSCATKDN